MKHNVFLSRFLSALLIITFLLSLLLITSCGKNEMVEEKENQSQKTERINDRLSKTILDDSIDSIAFFNEFGQYEKEYNIDLNIIETKSFYDLYFNPIFEGIESYSSNKLQTLSLFCGRYGVQHIEIIDESNIAVVMKCSIDCTRNDIDLSKNFFKDTKPLFENVSAKNKKLYFDDKDISTVFVYVLFKKDGIGSGFMAWDRTGEVYVLEELLSFEDYCSVKIGDSANKVVSIDPYSVYNVIISSGKWKKIITNNKGVYINKNPDIASYAFQRPVKEGILEIKYNYYYESGTSEITEITLYPYGDENNPDRFTLPNADVFKCLEEN